MVEDFSVSLYSAQTFERPSALTRGERWNHPPVSNLSNPLQMIEKHTSAKFVYFPFVTLIHNLSHIIFFSFAPPGRCQIAVRRVFKESCGEPDAAGAATGGGTGVGGGWGGRGKVRQRWEEKVGIVGAGTHGSAVSAQRQSDNWPFRRFHTRAAEGPAAAGARGPQSFPNKITHDVWWDFSSFLENLFFFF